MRVRVRVMLSKSKGGEKVSKRVSKEGGRVWRNVIKGEIRGEEEYKGEKRIEVGVRGVGVRGVRVKVM